MSSNDLKVVDFTWAPERIREFCETNDNWVLHLPADWTGTDIEDLYNRQLTTSNPYPGVIAEIAGDTRTPPHLLVEIKTRFGGIVEVAAALALNSQTPLHFLEELARNANPDVREHATTSLQKRRKP